MKVVIAGSRTIAHYGTIVSYILRFEKEMNIEITEVVSGTASGVDQIGDLWARKMSIPVKRFPAEYAKYPGQPGKATWERNKAMAEYGDACLIIWDGKSRGSKNMQKLAEAQGIPTKLYKINSKGLP